MIYSLQSFGFNVLTKLWVGFHFQVEQSPIVLRKGLNVILIFFFYLVDQKNIVFRVRFDELQQDSENRVLN